MLDKYDSDDKLLKKVQTGFGDLAVYEGDQRYLQIEDIFAATEPEIIEQQINVNPSKPELTVGINNLRKAKATKY